jgi:nucleotide-binding universal stress UspA family protein
MSYQRILAAIDRPPTTSEVFEQALDLAKKEGARLMVFHCIRQASVADVIPLVANPIEADTSLFGVSDSQQLRLQQEVLQEQTEQDQEWLQTYCQTAIAQGVPTEWDCKVGSRASSICDLARDWQADLIILGRGDLNGLKELFQGSVSDDVIHRAPCSVLVIQGKDTLTNT